RVAGALGQHRVEAHADPAPLRHAGGYAHARPPLLRLKPRRPALRPEPGVPILGVDADSHRMPPSTQPLPRPRPSARTPPRPARGRPPLRAREAAARSAGPRPARGRSPLLPASQHPPPLPRPGIPPLPPRPPRAPPGAGEVVGRSSAGAAPPWRVWDDAAY